jgi:seryl-tRNA synthetase
MLDINLLRNNLKEIQNNLKKRGFNFDSKLLKRLILKRKTLQVETESLQEQSNILAKKLLKKKIRMLRKQKLKEAKKISSDLKEIKIKLDKALKI